MVAWLVLTLVTSRCMQGMVNTNTWGCKQTCVSTCMGWINLHAMQTYMVYINIHIGDLAFMLFFMVTMALVSWHTLLWEHYRRWSLGPCNKKQHSTKLSMKH